MGARLVRHRIGDLQWEYSDAKAALRPVRDKTEHLMLLRQKVLEEFGELLTEEASGSLVGVATELADLLECVNAYISLSGFSAQFIENIRLAKLAERGGFMEGVVWDV